MNPEQQMAMAYDLALSFIEDKIDATLLAESIINLCQDFCEEDDDE